MAIRPGESTEVPEIKRSLRYGASGKRWNEATDAFIATGDKSKFKEIQEEARENDLSGMTPQERIKWITENKDKAYSITVKTTVGKANENNTSESVVPGAEDNQLSEEDKQKLKEEKAARDLKKRKALAALEGARPVRSKVPFVSYGEGDTELDFMHMSMDNVNAFAEGLSDEEIDRLAAEYDELTWYESAGLAVGDAMDAVGEGIDYCADKLAEGYNYVEGKLEEAAEYVQGKLDDGMNWLKENVLENEYFKMFTDAFTDGFCSMQPFPACLSCPHRKQLLSTEGFDLFRLTADINGALRKGIFDKVSSLIDCPGLAGALANGDLGSLKETMMTKGLDALVLTGIRCGSGAVFGMLGNCISIPGGKEFVLQAGSFINKYSGAMMKSVRSGHLDLISGSMKLADVKADSFFRISTKNTNYQFVNTTVSSPSYQKAYAKKYNLDKSSTDAIKHQGSGSTSGGGSSSGGVGSSDSSSSGVSAIVTAETLSPSAKAAVKSLEAAVTKSADEAKITLDNSTAEMAEDIAATKTKLASIEAETKRLMEETGSSEEEIVSAGLVDDKEVVKADLSAKLKAKAAMLDSNAALLSEQAPAESAGDKETLSSSGIRTRNSSISANRMSGVYGCTSSLHSLKLAYGADNRVTGRRLPSDIRFSNRSIFNNRSPIRSEVSGGNRFNSRSIRRGGVIIRTKSDLLFA